MGTAAYGAKGVKERTAKGVKERTAKGVKERTRVSGERSIGAAGFR